MRDMDFGLRVMLGSDTKNLPSYLETVHPAKVKKDRRSADEIKQYILEKLKEKR